MNQFGLIGKNIAYSFSAKFFTEKFKTENIENHFYGIFDLNEISEVKNTFQIEHLKGCNVTIPYKEQIIPFLDELDADAEKIGAVNCIKIQNGIKKGYNTDAVGFEKSIQPLLNSNHQNALILGDGGAAKAVKFVLEKLNIPFKTVTRSGNFTYSDLNSEIIQNHQVIVNCTPVGTFPNIDNAPEIPYEFLTSQHLLYDLIYNPEKTKFLEWGEKNGTKIKNGYEMLVLQAEKSWEIWNQPL
ncbi:shikimate dehydrogenase family protein [Moheibacter sediminis]|uniref:Shikimate dehydrogenase n=1 Tax=Moheibacter sediminis TaxID=1434700 RepID=A0A1W2BQQ2_9FLAO|nr:shikimate dehydrogenase [Moheibacter sediminis]SMC75259.1 shikimate dehydrogenase [Moheibacter sediminis]